MNTNRIILLITIGMILIGTAIGLLRYLRKKSVVAVSDPAENSQTSDILVVPITGIVIPLEQVCDDVFSSGVLGDGVAILPSNGEVYSPIDGMIDSIPESRHAIAMTGNNGVELLIHVGIDTVNLKGEYFFLHVKTGDRVKKGQLLMTFELDKIQKSGYDPVTPVILTETNGFTITPVKGELRVGHVLMSLEKKTE